MIVCIKGAEESENDDLETPTRKKEKTRNNTFAEVLVPKGTDGSINVVTNVVIVMDALKGFSLEPLQWALENVIPSSDCTITLLGVMPWLPLPLSCKTWLDVWTFDNGDLSALLKGRSDFNKSENKYQKIREILQLCEQKGVVPCMKVAMGHPVRLVVLEQTTTLHASFVVLDRHLRKNKAFFAERLPSSVVMMKRDKEVDMLKIKTNMDNSEPVTPQESPATIISTPEVILSQALSRLYARLKNPLPP